MKLKDLAETPLRVIAHDIKVPYETTELNYHGAIVKGDFDCNNTEIKSLEGSPNTVGGNFSCTFVHIPNLVGAPTIVGRGFNCSGAHITSLQGAPKHVGNTLNCFSTHLRSLHNIHKYINHIGEDLYLPSSVTSNVLGVMYIKGLQEIEISGANAKQLHAIAIINKHLQGDRDVHACQEEMLEAGLGEYAKL